MNGARHKRVATLRRKRRPAGRTVLLWYDAEQETREQAIARHFPKGVSPGVRLLILRWLTEDESESAPDSAALRPWSGVPEGAPCSEARAALERRNSKT
jgi:hypothetical protein